MSSLSASGKKEHDSEWESRGHNSEKKDVWVKARQRLSGESREGARLGPAKILGLTRPCLLPPPGSAH